MQMFIITFDEFEMRWRKKPFLSKEMFHILIEIVMKI